MVAQAEIYTGSKVAHFTRLRDGLAIPYSQMLFFDDSASGRFGNLEPVSQLGVLCAHCPNGLTSEVWHHAVGAYAHGDRRARRRDASAERRAHV